MSKPKNLPSAIIVAINVHHNPQFEDDVAEAISLTESAGFTILQVVRANRPKVDASLFVGKGKLDELKSLCDNLQPNILIINHNLTAVQERNLDRALGGIRVVDRTQLILDIFAQRVKSNEGKLQVELAEQSYLATRLVRRWTHLERQRGGAGMMGGSGEKQIELDKRAIRDKVVVLRRRLDAIVKQRTTQRLARTKNGTLAITIVGYTNAGKSTLFNALTKADVYAEDRLFATLQTTARHLYLDTEHEVVLADTVGFIRDLPTKLVAAFRATLEETIYANLLLHVVDVSDASVKNKAVHDDTMYADAANDILMDDEEVSAKSANYAINDDMVDDAVSLNNKVSAAADRQIMSVNTVLSEIKADHIPQLLVYNKIDVSGRIKAHIEYKPSGEPYAVYLAAGQKIGLDLLRQAIIEKLNYLNAPVAVQNVAYEPWKQ